MLSSRCFIRGAKAEEHVGTDEMQACHHIGQLAGGSHLGDAPELGSQRLGALFLDVLGGADEDRRPAWPVGDHVRVREPVRMKASLDDHVCIYDEI